MNSDTQSSFPWASIVGRALLLFGGVAGVLFVQRSPDMAPDTQLAFTLLFIGFNTLVSLTPIQNHNRCHSGELKSPQSSHPTETTAQTPEEKANLRKEQEKLAAVQLNGVVLLIVFHLAFGLLIAFDHVWKRSAADNTALGAVGETLETDGKTSGNSKPIIHGEFRDYDLLNIVGDVVVELNLEKTRCRLRKLPSDDLEDVTVQIDKEIIDDVVKKYPEIRHMVIRNVFLEDDSLSSLIRLSHLAEFIVSETNFGDQHVADLIGLKKLKRLYIGVGSQITDDALPLLGRMTQLRNLSLTDAEHLRDDALDDLSLTLRKTAFNRSWRYTN